MLSYLQKNVKIVESIYISNFLLWQCLVKPKCDSQKEQFNSAVTKLTNSEILFRFYQSFILGPKFQYSIIHCISLSCLYIFFNLSFMTLKLLNLIGYLLHRIPTNLALFNLHHRNDAVFFPVYHTRKYLIRYGHWCYL